jgi:uncharacterized membrane protein YsdA (DUF1294 family)/cold shock CspA family protein
MKSDLYRGTLKKWNDDRGFGFIQPMDGSSVVFIHISELKDATRRPQVNDTIEYYITADRDGKFRAVNAFISGERQKSNQLSPSSSNPTRTRAFPAYPIPVMKVVILSILPSIGSIHFALKTANLLPLILYPTMSLLTFFLYAEDKARAKRGNWRIPEQTLHLCELAGGWIGGFVAQRRFRHKSIKKSYQFVFWLIVIVHYILWGSWLFFGKMFLLEN